MAHVRLILFSKVFVIGGLIQGCQENNYSKAKEKMQVKINLKSEKLAVKLTNTFSEEIRIWDIRSLNGWDTFFFRLKKGDKSGEMIIIKRKEREWTGEGSASILKISSGKSLDFDVNIKDEWWVVNEAVNKMKNESLRVQAVFGSPGSADAKANSILVGEWESDWIVSEPPHKWLLSTHQFQLNLKIESGQLYISLLNISPSEIYLWDFMNAWGWKTLSFKLKVNGNIHRIERKEKSFNDNPRYITIQPGQNLKVPVNLLSGEWEFDKDIQKLTNTPIEIQAMLSVPVYPETSKYHAFFGSLQSEWMLVSSFS